MIFWSWDSYRQPLINEQIIVLIKGDSEESLHVNSAQVECYFEDDSTYNWNEIQKLFSSYSCDTEFSYEYGRECLTKLRPIWIYSEQKLNRLLTDHKYSQILSQTKWIRSGEFLLTCLKEDFSETRHMEVLLFLTAILENELGNVFFTLTNKTPPHLLKDLLKADALLDAFHAFPMFFLQILLGTPNCANLRNILWHGFPCLQDIPTYYSAVLILSIMSLSKLLDIQSFNIIRRNHTSNFENYFNSLTICAEDKELQIEISRWKRAYNKYPIIPQSHAVIWRRIFELYEKADYIRCIFLILPQLELLFRIIYGFLNKVDISAKRGEYYIILDTVFEEFVENDTLRPNELLKNVNEGVLKLIFDLFVAPKGPRLRDKVGHGEVDILNLNKIVCRNLIHLSFCFFSQGFSADGYESQFHPNSCLSENLNAINSHLYRIKSLDIPEELEHFVVWENCSGQLPSIYSQLPIQRGTIKIFFRPINESEITKYLTHIVLSIVKASHNLEESFKEKFIMFQEKQLRSKRRQTLEKTLQMLPKVSYLLDDIACLVRIVFNRLQNGRCLLLVENGPQLLKVLKHVLKIVTNLAKYCSKSSNEWNRWEILFQMFNELLDKHKTMLID